MKKDCSTKSSKVSHRAIQSFFELDCVEERYTEAFHFFRWARGWNGFFKAQIMTDFLKF